MIKDKPQSSDTYSSHIQLLSLWDVSILFQV